jgi:hypothetical protein
VETEVYAGIPSEEGHRDGPRFDAKFEFPETILQRPGGELVVAERGGPWLRLIDRKGTVRTQQLVGRLNETDVPLEPWGTKEDPTEVDQKVGLSRNPVDGSTDKRGPPLSPSIALDSPGRKAPRPRHD